MRNIRLDLFSPNIAFPVAYILYYAMGTTGLLGLAQDLDDLNMGVVQIYAFVGLISYFFGQLLVQPWRKVSAGLSPAKKTIRSYAKIFIIIGILSITTVIIRYRTIPLLDINSRQGVSAYLSYLANFAWIGCMLLIVFEVSKPQNRFWVVKSIAYYALACGLLILLAFRTPILLFSLVLTIYLYKVGKLKTIPLIILFSIFLTFGVIFWRYRYIQSYGYDSLIRLLETTGMPYTELHLLLGMLYLGFFRTSIASFVRLIAIIPDQRDYFLGKASLASIYSVLPGNQLSSRDLIAVLVTGRNPPPTSYTASLIGLPYVDYGIIGIILFMLILGFTSRFWYERSRSGSQYTILMYSLFSGIFILSIHTGLSDPLYYLIIPLMLYIAQKRFIFL